MIPEIGFAMRRVLASRTRRRALLQLGPAGTVAFARFLTGVVPRATQALRDLRARAAQIPDERLRREALASIAHKAYHVAGGCIYAAFLPSGAGRAFTAIVVPLETLYDYLDNLCDRHPGVDAEAFLTLHEALTDALDPARPLHDYFLDGPAPGDGGYLRELVVRTRAALAAVPDLERLRPFLAEAAADYAALQTCKHAAPAIRESALRLRHEANAARFEGLNWWESAAAGGSQFHVYALLYAALRGRPFAAAQEYSAYFPAMSALHVLLDDFIDQAEDAAHGELNFARCYGSAEELVHRFTGLYRSALHSFASLDEPAVHGTVLRVMALFYLTHPKVFAQAFDARAKELLSSFGATA